MDTSGILKCAQKVDEVARKFVLSHAVMAVRKIIEDEFKKVEQAQEEEIEAIKETLKTKNLTPAQVNELRKKVEVTLKPSHRIHIVADYCVGVHEGSARTIRCKDNLFEILLPQSLIDEDKPSELRKLVGHELGHFMFDFNELLSYGNDTLGTNLIDDSEKERRCDLFATNLIELRDNDYVRFNEKRIRGEDACNSWY
jgi:Zn-dependent peptidase ImmA (M78 family)